MSFIDLPIQGDVQRSYKNRVEQRPQEEFETALKSVFEFDVIDAVRWTQYTPYFNDGDPCYFSVHEYPGGVKFTDTEEFVSTEENADEWYDRVGGEKFNYNGPGYPDVRYVTVEGRYPEAGVAIQSFHSALFGGAHEDLLVDLFGDHAEVTVDRQTIGIDFYDHD